MPNVGGKKFQYTKAGKASAKKAMLKKMVAKHGKKPMMMKGDIEEKDEKVGGKYSFLKKFAKK